MARTGAVMSALRASALSAAFIEGRFGAVRRGPVWRVRVRPARVGSSAAIADDLSVEPFGALRWVLWNPDGVVLGRAGLGGAAYGGVGSVTGCRRQHWGLRLPLLLSLEGSYGRIRQGQLGLG